MHGAMLESSAGQTRWEDVEVKTFVQFAQFMYTGDYSTPRMIVRPSEPPPDEPQESDSWASSGVHSKKAKKKSPLAAAPTLLRTFSSLRFPLLKPRSNVDDTCDPAVSDGPSENISEVLILHTSLYVLADKWGIDSLKRLTLFKIHKTLTLIKLETMIHLDRPLEQIIDFVRYAYTDERTLDKESGMDDLRELICLYIIASAKLTAEHTAFMALMEEGGPLTRDLWKLAAPRINRTNSVEFMI
jgi:hypothetical protein